MKKIKLTQNKYALVDDGDYDSINKHKWCYFTSKGIEYAIRVITKPTRKTIYMHKEILGFPKSRADHKNGNGLDNRKENLRLCSQMQNCWNKGRYTRGNNKYKGTTIRNGKWCAQIGVNYKRIFLGYFNSEVEAAKAYNIAAKLYFGDFARLNDI